MMVETNQCWMSLDEIFEESLLIMGATKAGKTKRVFGIEREAAAHVHGVMKRKTEIVAAATTVVGMTRGGVVEIVTIVMAVRMEGGLERGIVIGPPEIGNLIDIVIGETMITAIVTAEIIKIATTETGDETDMMTEMTKEEGTTGINIETMRTDIGQNIVHMIVTVTTGIIIVEIIAKNRVKL